MKRFYSVKEASRLLGVSTNTVYKYLEEKKIESRRIGKGRIKILFSSLKPYIQEIPVVKEKTVPQIRSLYIGKKRTGKKDTKVSKKVTKTSEVTKRKGDFVFFRLYKGILLVGLGLLHVFENVVYAGSQGAGDVRGIANLYMLPFALSVIGLLVLVQLFYSKHLKDFGVISHTVSLAALVVYSLIAFASARYMLVVFPASLALIEMGHVVRKRFSNYSFFSEYTKYLFLLIFLGGMFVLVYPSAFPIQSFVEVIEANRAVVAILWFGIFVPPAVFLLSPNGKSSKYIAPGFFLLYAIISFIFATELTFLSLWSASFVNYITGIFALYLAWWKVSQTAIEVTRLKYVMLSFVWIMATLALGLWVILLTQEQARAESLKKAQRELGKISSQTSSMLEEHQAKLVQAAGSEDTLEVIESEDGETAVANVKSIFEKLEYAKGVVIYDESGIALGSYPRNYLSLGNDYSSTNYFGKTKDSYRSYISPVIKDNQGHEVIIQTEPVFQDNNFYGMLAVFIDLRKLSLNLTSEIDKTLKLHVVDENGVYILGTKPEYFGKQIVEAEILEIISTDNRMEAIAQRSVNSPGWRMYMEVPASSSLLGTSGMNIALSIFIMVNSIFSLAAGVIVATKRGVEEFRSSLRQPPIISPQLS